MYEVSEKKKENVFMIQLKFLITRIKLKLRYEIAPEIIRNVSS